MQEQLDKARAVKRQEKEMTGEVSLPPPPSSWSPALPCPPVRVDTPAVAEDMMAMVTEQEQEQGSRRKRSRGSSVDEGNGKAARSRMEEGEQEGEKQGGHVESAMEPTEPPTHGLAAAEVPTPDPPPPPTRQREAGGGGRSSSPRSRPSRWDQRPLDMYM